MKSIKKAEPTFSKIGPFFKILLQLSYGANAPSI
jgi:hypothetical protein